MYPVKQKWNQTTCLLMKINLVFIVLIFAAELADCATARIDGTAADLFWPYCLRHLLLPSAVNLALYLCGRLLLHFKSADAGFLRYVPIFLCMSFCFNILIWHPDYAILRAYFLFPLFLTVIFTDRKMTRLITLLALIILLLTAQRMAPRTIFRTVLDLATCGFAYFAACAIIERIEKKNQKIEESMDIRNKLAEELKRDHLTGLFSHGTYEKLMIDLTTEAEANHAPLCMAIIDIDNFKKINDNYGHAQGNVVLVALSELLQNHCTGQESAARYGGEEFVIFFPNTDLAVAFTKLDEMRRAFEALSFDFLPEGKHITFSTGLAAYPGNQYSNAFFFELADKAMYEAKNSGKNRICVQKAG